MTVPHPDSDHLDEIANSPADSLADSLTDSLFPWQTLVAFLVLLGQITIRTNWLLPALLLLISYSKRSNADE